MNLYELIKNVQHRKRFKEILLVFSEHEFGYIISKLKLHGHLPFKKRILNFISREKKVSQPERLRLAFEKLGPTFVKFGQLLSLRPDLIPKEYVDEFEKMQDKVPQFSFQTAERIIEEELKQPLNKVFTSFNKKPVASASIGQVYKAKIGNKNVAVKIQRPEISKTIKNDIELMYRLAVLLEENIPELKKYHLKEIIHEFEKWTIKELNFKIEAYYAKKIAENSKGVSFLKIPNVYSNISTEKVLVMEFLDGIPLHELNKIKNKKEVRELIKNGYYVFLKQVYIDGLFHADPHPGNILILKDNKLGLIDFGIVGRFDKKLKQNSLDFFRCILNNNPEKATDIILKMNISSEEINKNQFYSEFKEIFEPLQYTTIEDIKTSEIIKNSLSIINKYHLKIPIDFVLYGKTLMTLEGVTLKYYPEFNLVNESKSILKKLMNHTNFFKEIIKDSKRKISEYKELADTFPETALEILQKAKNFKLNIDIEDADVKNLTQEIERSSGNLALGLIIAALIVASALVKTSTATYIYIAGFILSGILALWLVHRTIFVKIIKKR
ncbi:MAG: AarF/ABC1/UbiB kinase family protein [Nanoarchaeota archaeon]|nr:AarF/ABC1/UbiB kinase family protein [Nanoarchaeota archaeon]MBU1632657.1 AarF/ABC1/UbiB kinase family protein [Nanoarchaeota archaeon]MBU1876213.1 AarF/ABC1/UbiB kinase family protein [Nanoarchaeota archaeon]